MSKHLNHKGVKTLALAVAATAAAACASGPFAALNPDVRGRVLDKDHPESGQHGIVVANKKEKIIVKSYSSAETRRLIDLQSMPLVAGAGERDAFRLYYRRPEDTARNEEIADYGARSLTLFLGEIFGRDRLRISTSIYIAHSRDEGGYSFKAPIADGIASLRFVFYPGNKPWVAGDLTDYYFAPFATLAHEFHHVMIGYERARAMDIGDRKKSRVFKPDGSLFFDESAAEVFRVCFDLRYQGKSMNGLERTDLPSDAELRSYLHRPNKFSRREISSFRHRPFKALWAHYFGGSLYVLADDSRAAKFMKLCTPELLRDPEALRPVLEEIANDGVEPPVPDKPGWPPEEWNLPAPWAAAGEPVS